MADRPPFRGDGQNRLDVPTVKYRGQDTWRRRWRHLGSVRWLLTSLVVLLLLAIAWPLLNDWVDEFGSSPKITAPSLPPPRPSVRKELPESPFVAPESSQAQLPVQPMPSTASTAPGAPAVPAAASKAAGAPGSGTAPGVSASAPALAPAPATAATPADTTGAIESQPEWRVAANAELKASLTETCNRLAAGRYPLVRGSRTDMRLTDFTTLFGPNGLMETFFQKHLAQNVDRTTRPWRIRSDDPAQAPAADGLLAFQRAAEIRRVLFANGSAIPTLRMDIKPIDIDPALRRIDVNVDGIDLRLGADHSKTASVGWPDPGGSRRVEVVATGADGAPIEGASKVYEGSWGLFHWIDSAEVTDFTDPPNRFRAVFTIGGRLAMFDITTNTQRNPFRLPELTAFRCPTQL